MQSKRELAAIIATYAWSGFALTLLTELRAILPTSAYAGIVVSIVVPIIAASYRIGFEDLIERLRANTRRKRTQKEERKLVREWARKWVDLADLVEEAIRTDDSPNAKQQSMFADLRYWFIRHRSEALPLWQTFDRNRTVQAHEDYSSRVAKEVLSDHWRDPFSCFYDIYSLNRLKEYISRHYGNLDEVRWVLSKLTC